MLQKVLKFALNADEKNILKRSVFWNMLASTLTGFITAIIVFFVTRINGVGVAGIINIASAYGYQCLTLGSFGVRNLQSSDVKYQYQYSDYFYHRIITSVLMYLLLIYYSFCSGYTLEKAIVIFLFGLFKSVDAIEDVYHGEYQRNSRLDVGSIYITLRQLASLVLFVITLILTKSIILSLFLMTLASFILFISLNRVTLPIFFKGEKRVDWLRIKELFIATLPLCIASFISMYLSNSPKYALDNLPNSDELQGYFGILSMPVFTINLISNMIFRPLITKISIYWNENKINSFIKITVIQFIFTIVLTFVITCFGYFIGLRLLEIIFGYPLIEYMSSFIILLIGGGAITLANLLLLLLTIVRAQNIALVVYIFGLLFVLFGSSTLVDQYGVLGASILYLIVWIIVGIVSILFLTLIIIRRRDGKCLEKS